MKFYSGVDICATPLYPSPSGDSDYILLNQSARFLSNSTISDPVLVQIFDSSCFELTERISISLIQKLPCPGVIQGQYPNRTIVIKDNKGTHVQCSDVLYF